MNRPGSGFSPPPPWQAYTLLETWMRVNGRVCFLSPLWMFCLVLSTGMSIWAEPEQPSPFDERVKGFLESQGGKWHDWNVSSADGRILYDLIVKNRYRRALEIGTSTGHSAIWMAWALSKTGGRLTTIEIDADRHKKALRNFQAAGLSDFIDARLADAHELVPKLSGPFDFVFSDADKEWYKRYFILLEPKLEVGGCFVAHNVSSTYLGGIREFVDHLKGLPHFQTTIDTSSGSGMSVSYKTSSK